MNHFTKTEYKSLRKVYRKVPSNQTVFPKTPTTHQHWLTFSLKSFCFNKFKQNVLQSFSPNFAKKCGKISITGKTNIAFLDKQLDPRREFKLYSTSRKESFWFCSIANMKKNIFNSILQSFVYRRLFSTDFFDTFVPSRKHNWQHVSVTRLSLSSQDVLGYLVVNRTDFILQTKSTLKIINTKVIWLFTGSLIFSVFLHLLQSSYVFHPVDISFKSQWTLHSKALPYIHCVLFNFSHKTNTHFFAFFFSRNKNIEMSLASKTVH